ncbi:MAG: PAS domain-containing sensor histidine kinase [Candidatus Helarchaeota archaeon]
MNNNTINKSLENFSEVGIIITEPNYSGKIINVNEYMSILSGYSKEELLKMYTKDFYINSKERNDVYKWFSENSVPVNLKIKMKKKDGSIRHILNVLNKILNTSMELVGIQEIFIDITDQEIYKQKLEYEKMLIQKLINLIKMGIILISLDGKIIKANEYISTITHLNIDEIIGNSLDILFTDSKYKNELYKWSKNNEYPENYNLYLKESDGEFKYYNISFSKIFDDLNNIMGYTGIIIDKTNEERIKCKFKNQIQKLKKKIRKLIDLQSKKDEFSLLITHELRNYLTSIIGYAQFLKNYSVGMSEDVKNEAIEIILRNSNYLERLINNLTYDSQDELDRIKLNKVYFNIISLIDECIKSLDLELKRKNIDLQFNRGNREKLIIHADIDRIRQVIINLIINAIKYSQINGKIIISIEKFDNKIKFSISDNGMGIPKKYQSELFNKYQRIFIDKNKINKGIGLGLYISKKIIELHNGIIGVFSEGKNTGSTFYFIIPIN